MRPMRKGVGYEFAFKLQCEMPTTSAPIPCSNKPWNKKQSVLNVLLLSGIGCRGSEP